jgi:hypothetical protein
MQLKDTFLEAGCPAETGGAGPTRWTEHLAPLVSLLNVKKQTNWMVPFLVTKEMMKWLKLSLLS